MALPRLGSMAHVMPFHLGLPDASAYCHISPMAATHSTTDDTWIAHVGRDRALAGSIWIADAFSGDANENRARDSDATVASGTLDDCPSWLVLATDASCSSVWKAELGFKHSGRLTAGVEHLLEAQLSGRRWLMAEQLFANMFEIKVSDKGCSEADSRDPVQ